jgi:hypothetical protein
LAVAAVHVCASEAEQLALVATEGAVCIRTDLSTTYIALNDQNATMGDWAELSSPTSGVISVNSKTGAVELVPGDIGAAEVGHAHVVGDVAGLQAALNETTSVVQSGLYRNAIINGNFDIWQRGTSFTGGNIYTADRWRIQTNQSYSHTIERIIEDGNTYLRATVDQVSSYYNVGTLVEDGRNLFLGQQLSLRVRCRASGNYTLRAYISSANTYDAVYGKVLDQAFTVTTAFKEYTFTTNRISNTSDSSYKNLRVSIYLFEAAANVPVGGYIDIDYITMNIGDKPLPFAPRHPAEELALCQRYYEKSCRNDVIPSNGMARHVEYPGVVFGLNCRAHIDFVVPKRVNPTMTWYRTSDGKTNGQTAYYNGNWVDGTNTHVEDVTETHVTLAFSVDSTPTPEIGLTYLVSVGWVADAEL